MPLYGQPQEPTTDELVRQGLMALQQRNLPIAQRFLEQAIELDSAEPRAWMGLAQIYRGLNLHSQALRHAEEAARIGEDDPVIQHALAMFHSDVGNWGEAAKWEEQFALGPGGAEAYSRAANLYLMAKMPLRAASVGEAGLRVSKQGDLYSVVGKAYAMAGREVDGLRHLELAVKASPYVEGTHYDLGLFHLQRMQFEEAKKAFEGGREYFDKSAPIKLGLGIAAYGLRDFEESVDQFLRASELAPALEQPHAFLGRLLQHATDRMEEVEARMKTFFETNKETHLGPFLYGQVQLARLGLQSDPDELAKIESLLRQAIERNDRFWESHYELGVLLEKKRDLEEAEVHLERAVELNPNASKPHYRLARVYQRLGKSKDAKRERDLHKRIAEAERQAMRKSPLPPEFGLSAP